MIHPVSSPGGDDRPSNVQSTLRPDPPATAHLDRPVDQVRPGTNPDTVRSTRADKEFIDSEARSIPSSGSTITSTGTPVPVSDRAGVVARQQERFGGIKAGSAFFGWLTATGMSVLLIAILTAVGVVFGVATDTTVSVDQAVQESEQGTGTAQTVGLVGAITLLVVLLVAYYCGGYVAGRMARFDGAKQGLAVWLWGVLMALIIAVVAAIAGAQYDVFGQLNLPRLPVNEGEVTAVGAVAIGAAILAALLGAVLGGLAGMRFHRRVDNTGLEPVDR